MTRESIVGERYARWVEALWRHGYVAEDHPRVRTSAVAGTIGVRGRRRVELGEPHAVIDIAEAWADGDDPDGLGLEEHGCFLAGSGWHARLADDPERGEDEGEGAERLDVDRSKPAGMTIHRHPLGRPNDEREPLEHLPAPEAWMTHVEQLSADLYDRADQDD